MRRVKLVEVEKEKTALEITEQGTNNQSFGRRVAAFINPIPYLLGLKSTYLDLRLFEEQKEP